MEKQKQCTCHQEPRADGFDAQQACDYLAWKFNELSDMVTRYMSEADLDRSARNANAQEMAERVKRIVGGTLVASGDYPECCLIGQEFPNGARNWFCTGVLVHPRVVLTAAHCHVPPRFSANVVALNTNDQNDLGGAEIISARRTVIHPRYPATDPLNDICALVLRQESSVAPVPMATTAELHAAANTTLVGFGRNDRFATRGFGTKREVDVPITHLRRSASDDLDDAEHRLGFESDLEFVAGGGGFDSCNGDSGGPAYVFLDNGDRLVAGLTSRGTRAANVPCGLGGIYTRVDRQSDFIQQVMADAGIDDGGRGSQVKALGKKKGRKIKS